MAGVASRLLVALLALQLVACEDADEDEFRSPSRVMGDERGEISLWITDGPVDDVDRVLITITALQFQAFDRDSVQVILERPVTVDLLDFDRFNPRELIIDDLALPTGLYRWLRLVLDESRLFVEVDGLQFPLLLSDDPEALVVDLDFAVGDDSDLDLTIDLDLRQSLFELGNNRFLLRPVTRIVNTEESGTLTGTVARGLIENDQCRNGIANDRGNAVYLFAGRNAVLRDIRGEFGDPLATTTVVPNPVSGLHEFRIDFLPVGEHTVVFTCDAALDVPDINNRLEMNFSDPFGVNIEAGISTELDIR